MVQAEGSGPGGDTYQTFFSNDFTSALLGLMDFSSASLGLMDFSDIVMLSSRPCQIAVTNKT